MHSFDRTMLASLGFADPDKGDPTHDLACQYLAVPENQLAVARRFSQVRLYCHTERDEYIAHMKANTDPDNLFPKHGESYADQDLTERRPVLEYVINKGEGKYKTTVGFVDLRLMYARKYERPFWRDGEDYVRREWRWSALNVEVKTNPVPIGNIIRQVKLYAEYVGGKWLVATTYPLAASDVSALNSCDIGHVTLGDRFAAWAAERRAADAACVPASTFTL